MVLPVVVYVALESYHKHDLRFFYKSPEWAIATIFLFFQGVYLYVRHSRERGRRLSESKLVIIALVLFVGALVSGMNALDSMHLETEGKIKFRLVLFLLASVLFLLLVASSKYKSNEHPSR